MWEAWKKDDKYMRMGEGDQLMIVLGPEQVSTHLQDSMRILEDTVKSFGCGKEMKEKSQELKTAIKMSESFYLSGPKYTVANHPLSYDNFSWGCSGHEMQIY